MLALIAAQVLTAQKLVQRMYDNLVKAPSISVTVLTTIEEFPRDRRVKYTFKRGGYFRAESGATTDVGNPKAAWTFDSAAKKYQKRTPVPPDLNPTPFMGLDVFGAGWPAVGEPKSVTWRGMKTLRIEVDGTRLTKETKLYLFLDPTTHLPLGVSANLGSTTQIKVLESLRIGPSLPASAFQWKPPKGWKEVFPGKGGWD